MFSLPSSVVFRYLMLLFSEVMCWHEMWRYLSLVLEWLTKWSTGSKCWQELGFYFLPPHPDCLQGPLNLLSSGYKGLFHQGQCDWSMKLFACSHQVPPVKNAWSFTSTASCLLDLVVRYRNFFSGMVRGGHGLFEAIAITVWREWRKQWRTSTE